MASAARIRTIMGDHAVSPTASASSPDSSPVKTGFARSWSGSTSSSSSATTSDSTDSLPLRRPVVKRPSLPLLSKVRSRRADKVVLDDDLPSPLRPRSKARALPPDLYDAIFAHLETARRLDGPHAYARDLQALALTTRAWAYVVHPRLYHTVYLRLADLQPPQSSKWFASKPKSRLKTLRATLRNSPWRARLMRRIVIADGDALPHLDESAQAVALDNLATLVDACPLLEHLSGIYPIYRNEHTRFDHVLSTRVQLKSHVWHIGPNDEKWNGEELSPNVIHLHPAPISEQVDHFVSLHSRWAALSSLVIQGRPDANLAHDRLLPFAFMALPSLRHLAVSNFLDSDFDDTHLYFLPKTLVSLRLEKLPGVTESGIQRFLTQDLPLESRWAFKSLLLLDMVIHRTAFLSYTLPFLPALERLAIRTPHLSVPPGYYIEAKLPPVLSSPLLKHLSWDLRSDDDQDPFHLQHVTETNKLLADCLYRGAFPSIQTVHVPLDPSGVVQRVCRPLVPRNAMEIAQDQTSPHALAAHMRAAHALGFNVTSATAHPSVTDDRNDDAFLAIECTDEFGTLIGRWEAPAFFGRASGPKVPAYDLKGWVVESTELMHDKPWGVDLAGLWLGKTGDRAKGKKPKKGTSVKSMQSSLVASPTSMEFPRH